MNAVLFTFIILGVIIIFAVYSLSRRSEKTTKARMVQVLNTLHNIGGNPYYLPFPVYYINMDKHDVRNTFMIHQLNNVPNTGYQRIKGVDGNLITNIHKDTIKYGVQDISFNTNYNLTKPEIGCVLSHIIAIQTAYNNNKNQIAMICEDDILLETLKLTKSLDELVKDFPADWEIVQLSCTHSYHEKKVYIKPWVEGNGSAAGYLINRKGMIKILNQCYDSEKNTYNINYISKKDKHPIHGISDVYLYTICKTYRTFPGIIIANNLHLHTTIQSKSDELWQIERSSKNIQNLINIFYEKKVNF